MWKCGCGCQNMTPTQFKILSSCCVPKTVTAFCCCSKKIIGFWIHNVLHLIYLSLFPYSHLQHNYYWCLGLHINITDSKQHNAVANDKLLIMVALCNRADHYIFMLWFVLLFFPRLISTVGDWMSTILRHMVWS